MRLHIVATEDACSCDKSQTSVSVTLCLQPGAYCYYYKGPTDAPTPVKLGELPRPSFPFFDSYFIACFTFFVVSNFLRDCLTITSSSAASKRPRNYALNRSHMRLIPHHHTNVTSIPNQYSTLHIPSPRPSCASDDPSMLSR